MGSSPDPVRVGGRSGHFVVDDRRVSQSLGERRDTPCLWFVNALNRGVSIAAMVVDNVVFAACRYVASLGVNTPWLSKSSPC